MRSSVASRVEENKLISAAASRRKDISPRGWRWVHHRGCDVARARADDPFHRGHSKNDIYERTQWPVMRQTDGADRLAWIHQPMKTIWENYQNRESLATETRNWSFSRKLKYALDIPIEVKRIRLTAGNAKCVVSLLRRSERSEIRI